MPKLTAATLFKASLALMMLAAGLATAFGYDRWAQGLMPWGQVMRCAWARAWCRCWPPWR